MCKNSLSFNIPFNFTAFVFVSIGLLLPWGTFAQDFDKSLPTIISFDIKHITVDEGDSKKSNWIEFSWKTEGARIVKLYKDGREIKGRNQLSDGTFGWPLSLKGGFKSQFRRSAVYEIVAENNVGKASKTLDTKMTKKESPPFYIKPEIVNFRVVPQEIKPGDKVSFYWQVKNAQQVQLFDRSGVIESRIQMANGEYGWPGLMNGAYKEYLGKSETYVLVATNKSGIVKKSVTVSVSSKE